MKLTISRDLLLAGLGAVLPAVPTRGVNAVLSNIHLRAQGGQLVLDATDGDVYISRALAVDIERAGDLLVPAAALNGYVKGLPAGPITLDADGQMLTVSSGRCKATFNSTLLANLFPTDDAPDGGFSFDAAGLRDAMLTAAGFAETDPSANQHYTRSVLLRMTGVEMKVMATDGKALYIRTFECAQDEADVLVPLPAVKAAVSAIQGETVWIFAERQSPLYFVGDSGFCRVPVMDSHFPTEASLRGIIDFGHHSALRMAAEPLKSALQRQLSFCDKYYAPCKFISDDGLLRIEGKQQEKGQAVDEVECEADGEYRFQANLHVLSGALAPFAKDADLLIAVNEPRKGDWPNTARITSPRLPGTLVIVAGLTD